MRQTQTLGLQVTLTSRDVALLHKLYIHNLLSFAQTERMVFTGRDHSTILNRLKRLELSGLISRERIHRIRHPVFNQDIGVVFQITTRGLLELQKYYPDVPLPEKPAYLHGRQIDHDLLVVEMAERARGEFSNHAYLSGVHVHEKLDIGSPRPDGVFVNQATGKWVAIEVELTMKSGDRYREIVVQYRMQRQIEKVIYFVSSTTIAKRIMSEVKGYNVKDMNEFSDKFFEVRLIERPSIAQPEEKLLPLTPEHLAAVAS